VASRVDELFTGYITILDVEQSRNRPVADYTLKEESRLNLLLLSVRKLGRARLRNEAGVSETRPTCRIVVLEVWLHALGVS
jgi:hypothetical protein